MPPGCWRALAIGGALDALATTLIDLLDELADDRIRICDLASGKEGGEHAEG
jgi:hypothetical protein